MIPNSFRRFTRQAIAAGFRPGAMLLLATAAPVFGARPWEFSWPRINPVPSPPRERVVAMAYDKARHQAVLVTGSDVRIDAQVNTETWIFDGASWTQRQPAKSPPLFHSLKLSYDERRSVVVLLGTPYSEAQTGDYRFPNELWEWDGVNWVDVSQAPQVGLWPWDRVFFNMAYDTFRGKLVVFGGHAPPAGFTQETWEYDGAMRQWALRGTSGPSPREPGGMAYDGARKVTLMAGGRGGQDYDDTWTWDGNLWELQSARIPIGPADGIGLVYDEFNKVVWAFGAGNSGAFYYPDTWAWDGVDYRCRPGNILPGICTNRLQPGGPSLLPSFPYQNAPAVYDPDRLRVTAFFGETTFLVRGNLNPVNYVDWRILLRRVTGL